MKFDKGVPLPKPIKGMIDILRTMEVGDSFLAPKDDASCWRNAMTKASAKGDRYFVSRSVEGGVRFWRRA